MLSLPGECEWLLEGPAEKLRLVRAALGRFCEGLGEGLLLLNFRNAVGRFVVPGIGSVNVTCGKWEEHHFEQMLEEVARIASGLPFDSGEQAGLPYERGLAQLEDVPYHAFAYLRRILSDAAPAPLQLMPVLRTLLAEPHRQLVRTTQQKPLEQVREVDSRILLGLLTQPHRWSRVPPEVEAHSPLARWMQGHLPVALEEVCARNSFDTPENRFVKGFLRMADAIIERIRRAALEKKSERLVADCQWMEARLQSVRRHPLWKDVGAMGQVPVSSPVLQHRRGYREVFHHFNRLRLVTRLSLSPKQALELLEAKNIALLYEIWTFFSVVEAMTGLLGARPLSVRFVRTEVFGVRVGRKLSIHWPGGVCALYNASFSPRGHEGRKSYSVRLRPDIALEIPSSTGAVLHLMDAKFKLERLEGKEESRVGIKQQDIHKMHVYRDAIPDAHTVWLLYPGTELRWYATSGSAEHMRDGLLPTQEGGIGGIPLRPGEPGRQELRRVLRSLLQ
jgi:hypothetical protein